MYAVFQNGSKQFSVKIGQIISIDKVNLLKEEIIKFNKVLMIVNNDNIIVGKPFIKNAIIHATILSHNKANKILILKFKRRKHYCKRQGHRQWFTKIRINKISN